MLKANIVPFMSNGGKKDLVDPRDRMPATGGTKTSGATDVITRESQKTSLPRRYKVILMNDNYTSMEFVVLVLRSVFHKSHPEAEKIMLSVHEKGAGVAGIYTKEIAETKVALVHHLAKQNEFPLRCTMEPE